MADLAGHGASSGAGGVSRNNRPGGTSRYLAVSGEIIAAHHLPPPELSLIATIMIQLAMNRIQVGFYLFRVLIGEGGTCHCLFFL